MAKILKSIRGHNWLLQKLLRAKQNKHLPHALLFAGPSGIGRKKTAYALAQNLLCTKSFPACGSCPTCLKVENQTSEHILLIQPENLYIKIETIRYILKFLYLQSFASSRIIIIDSAHQMNISAANNLLKILEEPPPNVYFILISSHISALPITIRSRLQVFRFAPLKKQDMPKNTEDWLMNACQGRRDQLEKWEENKNLRNQAFNLLEKAVSLSPLYSLNEISDTVKDKDKAFFTCLCWQQILRDARMAQLNKNQIIHTDYTGLIQFLKTLPSRVLDNCFSKVVRLEQDLRSHLDTKVLFDNLFIQIRETVKEG